MAEREVPCYLPGSFNKLVNPTFVQKHGVYWRSSLIWLQAELKAITDRLIVIYELQPMIFGQLVHLRKLSKHRKFALVTPLQSNAHFTFYGGILRRGGKHDLN